MSNYETNSVLHFYSNSAKLSMKANVYTAVRMILVKINKMQAIFCAAGQTQKATAGRMKIKPRPGLCKALCNL